MGVKFQRAKLIESYDVRSLSRRVQVQTYSDEKHPPLYPLVSITRIIDEGQAGKVQIPFSDTEQSIGAIAITYKTVWVPIGQQGWTIKIQCKLFNRMIGNIECDEIKNWQTVDTGQILMVESNRCNARGEHDTRLPAYARLEPLTLWYVDKVTIQSVQGVADMAQMELVLVRCWNDNISK